MFFVFFFFKQKTAYEMRIIDWSSDVCSSDLAKWSAKSAKKRKGEAQRISKPECRLQPYAAHGCTSAASAWMRRSGHQRDAPRVAVRRASNAGYNVRWETMIAVGCNTKAEM